MLMKVLIGTGIAIVLGAVFLLGSLALDPVLAQTLPGHQLTKQPQNDRQNPQYAGSIQVADSQQVSEANEAAGLQGQATITSAQAEAAALAANPGTTVVKTVLDNENGVLVYSVELSNGMDVKMDAGNGKVLHTEQAGNDANEPAGTESTSEQETVED